MMRVDLGCDLTIRKAAVIHEQLQQALSGKEEAVTLDCRRAEEVDVSALQLIVAARKSAQILGRRLTLAAPAFGVLRDALERGGFLTGDGGQPSPDETFWTNGEDVG